MSGHSPHFCPENPSRFDPFHLLFVEPTRRWRCTIPKPSRYSRVARLTSSHAPGGRSFACLTLAVFYGRRRRTTYGRGREKRDTRVVSTVFLFIYLPAPNRPFAYLFRTRITISVVFSRPAYRYARFFCFRRLCFGPKPTLSSCPWPNVTRRHRSSDIRRNVRDDN